MEIRRKHLPSKMIYYNEKLLKEQETTVHHKTCLCPEPKLGMKEIERRLEYYNYVLSSLYAELIINRKGSEDVNAIKNIKQVTKELEEFIPYHLYIKNGFNGFPFLTLRKTQLRMIPSLIKVLMNRPDLHYVSLEIVYICNARLLNVNRHEMSMDFIKDNCDFILNVPFFSEETECYARQKYCKLLLTLLHAYVMCEDLTNMNNVLNSLQVFRQSLLSSTYKSCACFMGKHDCIGNVPLFGPYEDEQYMYYNTFEDFESSSLAHTLNDIKDKVLKQELRSDCYLKCMINGIENTLKIREDLREEFILFIKQISVHNETELYNIIKTLCVLKMQPEIQNMFIQGLTDYMHVKCNKQNSIYLS
ncbi:Hypothetical predicted protein [Mytilus galloprovincialis]|uniref:Uncharacterized protein n=1 Tax=Mytilus galloprovincialis TaxID=29158 RepID=A0A8B6G843_MYTGA|nr:Hypothetical predicted protein [Mytilus galloprovincialis]